MGQTGGGYVAGATGVVAWLRPEHRIHAVRGPASPKIFHSPKGGTPLQRGPTVQPVAAIGPRPPNAHNRWSLDIRGQPQAVPHMVRDRLGNLIPRAEPRHLLEALQVNQQRQQRLRALSPLPRPGDLILYRGEEHMQHPRRGQPPELRIGSALDRRQPRWPPATTPNQDASTVTARDQPSRRNSPNCNQPTPDSRSQLSRATPTSPLPLSGVLGLPPLSGTSARPSSGEQAVIFIVRWVWRT